MSHAGQLDRRVTFQRRALVGAVRSGDWEDVVTRDARIEPRTGGETVQAARMAGKRPVKITVYREAATKAIDNAWRAFDARAAAESPAVEIAWDILSAQPTEDRVWIEIEAVQRLADDA